MNKKILVILASFLAFASCANDNKSDDSSPSSLSSESMDTSAITNSTTASSSSEEAVAGYKQLNLHSDLNSLKGMSGLTPSTGNVNFLVIPVHFSDTTNSTLNKDILNYAFNGQSKSEEYLPLWKSVKEYYETSSYGKFMPHFEVSDVFTPSFPASYYQGRYTNTNYTYASESILKDALTHFDDIYDYSNYDNNNDGYIDGVYLIYDHPVDYTSQVSMWWAFTSYYDHDEDSFDGLNLRSYIFAGDDFLKENEDIIDTHTYIHETAHLFGIDDYYDYFKSTGATAGGLASGDMMDGTIGDHNPFTKGLLNWTTTPSLITTTSSVTLNLAPFEENGDFIILANDFNEDLNLAQEYFILEYYTPTSLHEYDKMFNTSGIRMFHVNGSLRNGKFRYDNSSTTYKMISQITNSNGATYLNHSVERADSTLFIKDEQLITCRFDDDTRLKYQFTVNDLTSTHATITFNVV